MTNALELFSDVQLSVIDVHLIPGQAEDFAAAQAEDENQNEGCDSLRLLRYRAARR